MEKNHKFDKRALTSVSLAAVSILLPLSIFLPHTPIFEHSEKTEHLFISIHATAGLVFTILLVIHLILNRKALKKYFIHEKQSSIRKDGIIASVVVILIIILLSTYEYFIQ